MNYMVVECHPGYAVVLDESGRFIKVANRHYEIGQMVHDVIPMQTPAAKPKKWLYSLVAMAACLVLLLTAVLPGNSHPYASVYVKINPEIRIDVDKSDRVIGLEGINSDGIALIRDYDYHKKDLELVTNELVDLAIAEGYLQANGQISLTLDSADQIWVTDHSQALSDHMHEHLQDLFTVTIEVSLHHSDHNDTPIESQDAVHEDHTVHQTDPTDASETPPVHDSFDNYDNDDHHEDDDDHHDDDD